jgi:hypothetical protein
MSEFIKHIKSQIIERRDRPQRWTPLHVSARIVDEPYSVNVQKLYEIKVEWITRGYCEPRHFDIYLDNVIRELREAVYGELREKLFKLERAIYEQEMEQALTAINAVMREVEGRAV